MQLCVELRINCATLTAPAHILHQLQLIMECRITKEEMCKKLKFLFYILGICVALFHYYLQRSSVQLLSPDPRCCRPYMLVGAVSCCQQLMPGAVVSSKPVSPVTTCQRLHLALRLHCNRISAAPRLSCSQRAWYEHIKSRPLSITRGNHKLRFHPASRVLHPGCIC